MTRLIPTDATHQLHDVYFRLPRTPDRSDGSWFEWDFATGQWLVPTTRFSLDEVRGLATTVAFTRQY